MGTFLHFHASVGDPARYPKDFTMRRFAGLKAIVRSEVVQVEKAVHIQVGALSHNLFPRSSSAPLLVPVTIIKCLTYLLAHNARSCIQ
jgi:hypothetical protein